MTLAFYLTSVRWAEPFGMQIRPNSFTKHFGYDEDDDSSEKASASQKIYQGVTGGGKHVW